MCEIVYNGKKGERSVGNMEKKAVRAERETDSHGKRILYDIYSL